MKYIFARKLFCKEIDNIYRLSIPFQARGMTSQCGGGGSDQSPGGSRPLFQLYCDVILCICNWTDNGGMLSSTTGSPCSALNLPYF